MEESIFTRICQKLATSVRVAVYLASIACVGPTTRLVAGSSTWSSWTTRSEDAKATGRGSSYRAVANGAWSRWRRNIVAIVLFFLCCTSLAPIPSPTTAECRSTRVSVERCCASIRFRCCKHGHQARHGFCPHRLWFRCLQHGNRPWTPRRPGTKGIGLPLD